MIIRLGHNGGLQVIYQLLDESVGFSGACQDKAMEKHFKMMYAVSNEELLSMDVRRSGRRACRHFHESVVIS
jgi:hypothetical protein